MAKTRNRPAPNETNSLMCAILLVEDHNDTRHGIVRLLRRWGHAVREAATMSDGLELAASANYDFVLSDIGLPDGDGYQLMRSIRRARPNIPAVALTAYCTDNDRREAFAAGFNEHLCKPLDVAKLRALVPA